MQAIFISDLHLHPHNQFITTQFTNFVNWLLTQPQSSVYILGDFLHAWPGDEALDDWSLSITSLLAKCDDYGHKLYFMPGNRDFLIGKKFAAKAHWHVLKEPTCINVDGTRVLLVHGDRYCTYDYSHQALRCLTRNKIFIQLFLALPYNIRAWCVGRVRQASQNRRFSNTKKFSIVSYVMLKHMQKMRANIIIHGHIHQAGLTKHNNYFQYVLSDWDDFPTFVCYNSANGFEFLTGEALWPEHIQN